MECVDYGTMMYQIGFLIGLPLGVFFGWLWFKKNGSYGIMERPKRIQLRGGFWVIEGDIYCGKDFSDIYRVGTLFTKEDEFIAAMQPSELSRNGLTTEPVAMRYGWDGYGYKYIDNGSGSDWQTRIKGAEPLYEAAAMQPSEPCRDAVELAVHLEQVFKQHHILALANGIPPFDEVERRLKAMAGVIQAYRDQSVAEERKEVERLREALDRQCDNMAFIINHVPIENDSIYHKFMRELEEDRTALTKERK